MAPARLKVYRARMGFADTVVAAPNQKAALVAWGARQNLFAEGLAEVTDEPGAIEAAVARPGEVLQRTVGSKGPFRPEAASPPELPPASKPRHMKPQAPPKPPPEPDRSALDAAEAALRKLDQEEADDRAEIQRRRAALDEDETALKRDLARRRAAAKRTLDAARRAFIAAGGKAAS